MSIKLKNKETGEVEREYTCSPQKIIELCFANIECLLHIALADPDEHIKELGGEDHLLDLMQRYLDVIREMSRFVTFEIQELNDSEYERLLKNINTIEKYHEGDKPQ